MALDSSDDEEIGEFIYRTSQTAKLLREKKQYEDEEDMKKSRTRTQTRESMGVIQHTSNRSIQKATRIECSVEGCTGKAADSGTCMKKHKGYNLYSHEVCTNKFVKGGVYRHGAKRKVMTCSHRGCTNQVVQGGVCNKRHDAVKQVRKPCSHERCSNQIKQKDLPLIVHCPAQPKASTKKGGVCISHGAKRYKYKYTCKYEGCTNHVVSRGVCVRHGASWTRKKCSHDGCTNIVVQGGVCIKHGAKVKTCSHEGCTNKVKSRGVCIKHGAKVKTCSHEGCTKYIVKGGLCTRHYNLSTGGLMQQDTKS